MTTERCRGEVKVSPYRWARCGRPAHQDGLCKQHWNGAKRASEARDRRMTEANERAEIGRRLGIHVGKESAGFVSVSISRLRELAERLELAEYELKRMQDDYEKEGN